MRKPKCRTPEFPILSHFAFQKVEDKLVLTRIITLEIKEFDVLAEVIKLGLRFDGSKKSQYPEYAAGCVKFSLPEGVLQSATNRTQEPVPLIQGRIYFGELVYNCSHSSGFQKAFTKEGGYAVRTRCGQVYALCPSHDMVIGVYPPNDPMRGEITYQLGGQPSSNMIQRMHQNIQLFIH